MSLHGRLSLLPAAAALIGDPRLQILTRDCCLVPDAQLHISTFREFPKRGSSPVRVVIVFNDLNRPPDQIRGIERLERFEQAARPIVTLTNHDHGLASL